MLTIASLTLREALRRRIAVFAATATAVIVGLSAWGLQRLVASAPDHLIALAVVSALCIFVAFVFSVILALGAALLAAPAIAGEVETGIVLAILPRPLSRTQYVLGKWLGLAVILAAFAAAFSVLEAGAIALVTGYTLPDGPRALAYLIGQSIVMLSLALALSTRLAPVTGGLVAVLGFGVAWIAGIVHGIASTFHNAALLAATTLIGLVLPSDGLWRGALFHLEPVALLVATNTAGAAATNPFGTSAPPPAAFIVWSVAWVGLTVTFAALSFVRRDL